MKIVLHAGHGKTPPGDYGYCRFTRAGRSRPPRDHWHYQRGWIDAPDGARWIEDLATAEIASLLVPELARRGHQVVPVRAMDPVTGELDRRRVCPDQVLPGLPVVSDEADERWRYCGAVEAALRQAHGGQDGLCPAWRWKLRGSFDPVAFMPWEHRQGADLYLSLHLNWYSNSRLYGFTAHHYPSSRNGATMANRIYQGVLRAFAEDPWAERAKLPWGRERVADGCRWGVYAPKLWELNLTQAPAVILELAFASNPDELARITSAAWQHRMVNAIADSIFP